MKPSHSHTFLTATVALAALCGAGLTALADYPSEVLALKPLTYWRFGESGLFNFTATNLGTLGAAGNGAYDDPLAITGKPGALFGSSDTAAGFEGSYTKIDVPFDASLNPSSFTVECWAKVQGGAGNYRSPVTSRESVTGITAGYILYATATDTWGFWTGNGTGWNTLEADTTNGPVVIGAWTHLVGTYDASTLLMSFYINGALVMRGTNITYVPVGTVGSQRPVRVGSGATEGNGNYWFNGSVDEVAVYPTVLTASQVAAHYAVGTTNGSAYPAQVQALQPVLYLRLDETNSVPPAANLGSLGAAGNGAYEYGIKPAATDLTSPSFPGLPSANQALVFDGTQRAMRIGLPNVPTPWSTVFWVNRQDAPGVSAALLWSAATGIKLEQYSGATPPPRNLGFTAYGVADYNFTPVLSTGVWSHVAYVGDGTQTLLYINGSLQDSNPASITLPMTSLGNPNGDFLAGYVAEMATFDQALMDGQIMTLYLTATGDQSAPAFVSDTPILSPAGTIYATTTFTIAVDVYGAELSFQWFEGNTLVGTNAIYTKTGATAADTGNYKVVVSNAHGTVTSGVVAVTINPAVPPTITQQPAPVSVYAGADVSFTVAATGTTPITYQWTEAGTNIVGATNQTFIVTNVSAADAASYTVGLTNVAGGILSASASLTLATLAPGSYVEAVVTNRPVNYWRFDETSGTTAFDSMGRLNGTYTNGVTLGLPGGVPSGGPGDTSVQFDGQGGAVILGGASIPVPWTAIFWVNRPDPVVASSALLNDSVTSLRLEQWDNTGDAGFTAYGVADYAFAYSAPASNWVQLVFVAATNGTALYANGLLVDSNPNTVALPRQSFSRLGTTGDQLIGGLDDVTVYDHALSADAITAIYAAGAYGTTTPPRIVQEPVSRTAAVGDSLAFSVQASGSLPFAYQWFKGAAPIPGAAAATLTFPSAAYTDSGTYSVTVTNANGSTNSAAVTLLVLPKPLFANATNNLILHLKFDGTYADSSGQGNDAGAVGNPVFVPGKLGQGVQLTTTVSLEHL